MTTDPFIRSIRHLHLRKPCSSLKKSVFGTKKMGQQCRLNRSNTCYYYYNTLKQQIDQKLAKQFVESVEQPTISARDRGAGRPRAERPCNIQIDCEPFLLGTCCVNHNKLTGMVGDTVILKILASHNILCLGSQIIQVYSNTPEVFGRLI